MNAEKSEQKELEKIFDTVVALLKENEKYRDDNNLLVNRIHRDELAAMGIEIKKLSVYNYWELIQQGKLTKRDSITRASRLAQANPLLGVAGNKRKKKLANQPDYIDTLRKVDERATAEALTQNTVTNG
jgi:hypothetical protein